MAEHDSDREEREEREPEEQNVRFDEDAAWAAIVAGYGEEPPDPPGAKPFKSVEDLALLETETNDSGPREAGDTLEATEPRTTKETKAPEETKAAEREVPVEEKPAKPLGGSVAFAPGVGPRDYSLPEPADEEAEAPEDDDEGHFVPPEPPPLPTGDTTAKFAWLGVLGGPVLILLAVLLGWEMTWWLTTLGIGGFLGGFATLVMRMRPDDEDDDPGRGAVV
ncbi:hypothetical protein [Streptomyces sp. ALI-76-A]|uniref:hypothetical protein n=1 Tax=Streptomyces sp. ALI-76-A TaxID=3025736 RepID=UPI00256F1F2B|nr:hypothetical protein [Streptomyces sp. ALI-76-A]MDL5201089.1 hypothetical protein [Streptomyces sp. ALI-76-A]